MVTIERMADLDELLALLRRHGVYRARLGEMEFELGSPPMPPAAPDDAVPREPEAAPHTARLSSIPVTDPLFDGVEGV